MCLCFPKPYFFLKEIQIFGYPVEDLIQNAIRWLKKSAEAEEELAKYDRDGEDTFIKLHRTRSSQVLYVYDF